MDNVQPQHHQLPGMTNSQFRPSIPNFTSKLTKELQYIKKSAQGALQREEELSEKIERIKERMKEDIFCPDIAREILELTQKTNSPTSQHKPLHDKFLQDDDDPPQDDDNLPQDDENLPQDDDNLLQDDDNPPNDDDNLLQDDDNPNLQNIEGPFDNPFHNYVFHKYSALLPNVDKPNLQINKTTEDQEDSIEEKNYIPTQVVTDELHDKLHQDNDNLNLQNVEVSTFKSPDLQNHKTTGTRKLMRKLIRKRNLSELKWYFYLENWNTASDINMKIIIPKDWNSKEEIIRNLFLDSQTKLDIRTFQDGLIEGCRRMKTDDGSSPNLTPTPPLWTTLTPRTSGLVTIRNFPAKMTSPPSQPMANSSQKLQQDKSSEIKEERNKVPKIDFNKQILTKLTTKTTSPTGKPLDTTAPQQTETETKEESDQMNLTKFTIVKDSDQTTISSHLFIYSNKIRFYSY